MNRTSHCNFTGALAVAVTGRDSRCLSCEAAT